MRDPIAHLVHRYADAVVHADGAAWAATWAPDARWELGGGHGVEGRDQILEFWYQAMSAFDAVVQTVLNGSHDVTEGADRGAGRWYIQEHYARSDGDRGLLLAHYDDNYVHLDGQWFFARRELVVDYGGPTDLSGRFSGRGRG